MSTQEGKKPASHRRATIPRRSDYTKRFRKDWERLSRSGRYDMVKLKSVMLLIIANDTALPDEFRDHQLSGNWKNHRECHVGGDFLLVYSIDEDQNVVAFTAAGTHSEIFD